MMSGRYIYFRARNILISLLSPSLLLRLVAWHDRYFGEIELRHLSRIVPADCVALDVGANYGVYSYYLSRIARQVHAYEPNPGLVQHLRAGCPSNVTVHGVALSNTSGNATLKYPIIKGHIVHGHGTLENRSFEGDVESCSVKMERLDDQGLDDVGFIKIDVEGHEEAVIKGGLNLIARCRPRMLIEIETRHRTKPIGDIISCIEDLGYHTFHVTNNKSGEAVCISAKDKQSVAALRGSSQMINYYFLPKEGQYQGCFLI